MTGLVPGATAAEPQPASVPDDVQALADVIDGFIERRWVTEKVTPAEPASDSEYLRRVYLDVAGKVPPVADVRDFLSEQSPRKRLDVVERLLDGPTYIAHFTDTWRAAMFPEVDADAQVRFLLPGFEAWLRKKLADNAPYDALVREIVTTPLSGNARANPYQAQGEPAPYAFYQAKQLKPENLAAATARIFLGVRIECAQCHNHPFDSWKREQFWEYAAFFAGLQRQEGQGVQGMIRELFDRRELNIPGTSQVVQAAFLGGSKPEWKPKLGPRETLATWMTSSENPWFARAAVNRMWAHFFGTGLVDPVDDFTSANPPSHPELLDELARQFAAHHFDLKFLIRVLTATKTYQLTSRLTHPSQESSALFARMALKGLTPEQLFDSLAQATGYYEAFGSRNRFAFGGDNTPRAEFIETFSNTSQSPTEQQSTVLQALAMMNGPFMTTATSVTGSTTLAAIASFPLMNTSERVESLYLAAFGRKPRPDEASRWAAYVDSGGPKKDPQQALADVFWALLNSSEFLFNH